MGKSFIGFCAVCLCAISQIVEAQPLVDRLFDEVRATYSAENAFESTAYVEQFFRLPGNRGYDSSLYHVVNILEKAGFQAESQGYYAKMTYRIEQIPMDYLAWEPVSASLSIKGDPYTVLTYSQNRNMICINSHSTPEEGITAELVYVSGCGADAFKGVSVKGKIVMGDCDPSILYYEAVQQRKALGVLAYKIPSYNQPQLYTHSIPFKSIPQNKKLTGWAINLSYAARERLLNEMAKGPVALEIHIDTKMYPATELAVIAKVKGDKAPEQEFVYSAHIQEPGANDNASGVGCQAEMARVLAQLVQEEKYQPARTITFLWGDEIDMTRRYIQRDDNPDRQIMWGMSLDMVGENTDTTGGVFLVEKMPDPAAIWTRGKDQHTEWGAAEVDQDDLMAHYFNDFMWDICVRQGKYADWEVSYNPYEGGSDHQPFLDADIPALLLWHFTDVFYHTDADRIDKVSPNTLQNVGVSALVAGMALCAEDDQLPLDILFTTKRAADKRLADEFALSYLAIDGADEETIAVQREILLTWTDWYLKALGRITEIPIENVPAALHQQILQAQLAIETRTEFYLSQLK